MGLAPGTGRPSKTGRKTARVTATRKTRPHLSRARQGVLLHAPVPSPRVPEALVPKKRRHSEPLALLSAPLGPSLAALTVCTPVHAPNRLPHPPKVKSLPTHLTTPTPTSTIATAVRTVPTRLAVPCGARAYGEGVATGITAKAGHEIARLDGARPKVLGPRVHVALQARPDGVIDRISGTKVAAAGLGIDAPAGA